MSLQFTAPPVLGQFMRSDAFGRLVAGPVGSGKTTACIVELLRRSIEQHPGQDGIRYTRWALLRLTLKQLRDTILRDAQQWLQGLGEWKVSESTFYINFGDVRSEMLFIPMENAEDQARLLSSQLTGCWISEAIEMNIDILGPISGRCGRYPSAARGVPTWHGIIADTNFPVEGTDWYNLMENPPPNWDIFKQPGGLKPDAENLPWLAQTEETMKLPPDHPARIAQGRKYYERLVETHGEESPWVYRYVHAQYGPDPSGMAVFQHTYNADFHAVDETHLIPGYPLLLGQDFGRNPWTLIGQSDHMGRLIIHEELGASNKGLEKHLIETVRPRLLMPDYIGRQVAVIGDPAGVAKGSIQEESCFDALKRLGFAAVPAPTNDIDPRLRAVETLLGRNVRGGPALIINKKKCPMLARAMAGGYRYSKLRSGALRPIPDKNDKYGFSHVADCLQYLALVVHGGMMDVVARALAPRRTTVNIPPPSSAWT